MATKKKQKQAKAHSYTEEQSRWIMSNAKLNRTLLAEAFNKKYKTNVTGVAIAKRKQRLAKEGMSNKKIGTSKRVAAEVRGGTITAQDVLNLLQDQGRAIQSLIDKM